MMIYFSDPVNQANILDIWTFKYFSYRFNLNPFLRNLFWCSIEFAELWTLEGFYVHVRKYYLAKISYSGLFCAA